MKRARHVSHTSHAGDREDMGSVDPREEMNADELRADIERTREDLGETVEGLAAKADVKARALRAVDDGKHAVSAAPAKAAHTARTAVDKVGQRNLIVGAASAAVMAAAVWAALRGARVHRARKRGLCSFWPW